MHVDTEWKLDQALLYHALTILDVQPTIDLFASRINTQFALFASYRADPQAHVIDCFSVHWGDFSVYCFSPFSVLPRVLQKIKRDKASGVVVAPIWKKTTILAGAHDNADRETGFTLGQRNTPYTTERHDTETPAEEKTGPAGMQSIRERYRQQGFSENATKFLMSSWRHSTKHMYDVYIRKWERYASERKMDKVSPPLIAAVNFLASLAESDLSYSAVCTARSALSSYLCTNDGVPFGKKELVKRLIKLFKVFSPGVFERKPAFPKSSATWDVNIDLKELETWTPIEKLTLKEISLKLCMLIALLSGQRCQTLQALRTGSTCMELSDKKCTFYVHSLLKHSRSGSHQAPT